MELQNKSRSQRYEIATATRQQLNLAVDWAAAEGWNPGLHDADCFYAADPQGFFVGLLEGEPIATLSAVRYGRSYGFLGFYIVKSEYRGMGYGLQIWQAGLNYLQKRTVGLDGVVAQQANYIKSGFELAHRNIRYEGIGGSVNLSNSQTEILTLSSIPFEAILDYDSEFFPDDRSAFLKCWVQQPASYAVGVMGDRNLSGYGLLRVCRRGYKVGPLFANTPQIARDILLVLIARIEPGVPFYLDVPQVNKQAVGLAESHHMHPMFETARMYMKSQPDLSLNRTYGITTFELG